MTSHDSLAWASQLSRTDRRDAVLRTRSKLTKEAIQLAAKLAPHVRGAASAPLLIAAHALLARTTEALAREVLRDAVAELESAHPCDMRLEAVVDEVVATLRAHLDEVSRLTDVLAQIDDVDRQIVLVETVKPRGFKLREMYVFSVGSPDNYYTAAVTVGGDGDWSLEVYESRRDGKRRSTATRQEYGSGRIDPGELREEVRLAAASMPESE